MFDNYLVTGATGFLGRAVIDELIGKGAEVRALVLENDPLAAELPRGVTIVRGDVCNEASLEGFFHRADHQTCVIHCAGIVSIASDPGSAIYKVNVFGTKNILRYCERSNVGKLVYVSSVHAIPEKPKGTEITEDAVFYPGAVRSDYAKSKALATSLVFGAADRGLNASAVFPSGLIGPGDSSKGGIAGMLLSLITGRLYLAVRGGYDFADVRDVASGITACAEHGLPGRGYILSGHYASVRDILETAKKTLGIRRRIIFLPLCLAKLAAPVCEKRSLRKKQPLFFTPCSVEVLGTNSCFSRRVAETELNYAPRSVESSIRDMVLWLTKNAV